MSHSFFTVPALNAALVAVLCSCASAPVPKVAPPAAMDEVAAARRTMSDFLAAEAAGDPTAMLKCVAPPVQRYFREPQVLLDRRLITLIDFVCSAQQLENACRARWGDDIALGDNLLVYIRPGEVARLGHAIAVARIVVQGDQATATLNSHMLPFQSLHLGNSGTDTVRLLKTNGHWKIDCEETVSDSRLGSDDSRLANINSVRFVEILVYPRLRAMARHYRELAQKVDSGQYTTIAEVSGKLSEFDDRSECEEAQRRLPTELPEVNDSPYMPF